MKKGIIIFLTVIVVVLAVLWFGPLLFRDKALQLFDETLSGMMRADISHDRGAFDISMFRRFPHPTVRIGGLQVINREPFDGDTLLSDGTLGITLDLFSLMGSDIRIRSVDAGGANLSLRVSESGAANYDIFKEDTVDAPENRDEAVYSVEVDSWSVTADHMIYEDETLSIILEIKDLRHRGSGDFTQDVVDVQTETLLGSTALQYDGIGWLAGHQIDAAAALRVQLDSGLYRLSDCVIRINDLPLSLDGSIVYREEYIDLDLDWATEEAGIKSLYSLVPAAYTASYDDIDADGVLSLSGALTGRYDVRSLPDLLLDIEARDGRLQYPGVSQPIRDIWIDAHVATRDGDYEQIEIDVRTLQFKIGDNPVDASVHIKNLVDYEMNADVQARLDLSDLSTVFPMPGYTARGLLDIRIQAEGKYDSIRNIMPSFDATASLSNGYLMSDTLQEALQDVRFDARLVSPEGNMKAAVLTIEGMRFRVGEDDVALDLTVRDFTNYQWNARLKGMLDLGKVSPYFAGMGTELRGRLAADIRTNGNYSDIEQGQYADVSADGELAVEDVFYKSDAYPFHMEISNGSASLSPQSLRIEAVNGAVGRSDIQLEGALTGYLDFLLREKALLQGNIDFRSQLLDLNQWITGNETEQEGDDVGLEAFELPENVDLVMTAAAEKLLYDNLVLRDAAGKVRLHHQKLTLQNLVFNMLGGAVSMSGSYDTGPPDSTMFDYRLDVEGVSIPGAVTAFESVRRFAPMARQATGKVSSGLEVSGALGARLEPLYETYNGTGSLLISDAAVRDAGLVGRMATLTGYGFTSGDVRLDDVSISASVRDGRSYVKPFQVQLGDHAATVSGSVGIDGSLDYSINTQLEAGELGVRFNSLVAQLRGGGSEEVSGSIPLQFRIGGTYDNPKIALAGTEGAAETVAGEVKEDVAREAREGLDNLMKGDTAGLQEQVDSIRESVDDIKSTGEGVKGILDGLFGNKKKDKKN